MSDTKIKKEVFPKMRIYQKDNLKFEVICENELSDEAMESFNNFYNEHWNVFNK